MSKAMKGSLITVRIPFFPGAGRNATQARLTAVFDHPHPTPEEIVEGFQAANTEDGCGPIADRLRKKILTGKYRHELTLIHKVKR